MGPADYYQSQNTSIVLSRFRTIKHPKSCYAITAKYLGLEDACVEYYSGACLMGGGTDVELQSFREVGESTEISRSQYSMLVEYATDSEYDVSTQPTRAAPTTP